MEEREYVFGHRQLAAIAFVMVGLMGVAATMAYLVGRASSPGTAIPVAEAKQPAKRIVITEEVVKPSPSALSPDPIVKPAPKAEAAPNMPVVSSAMPPVAAPAPASAGPSAGSHYYQVVSTDQAQAAAIIDRLSKSGVQALTGEGPSPDRVRVYAGPVNDGPSQAEVRSKLEAAGFRPFLKKF